MKIVALFDGTENSPSNPTIITDLFRAFRDASAYDNIRVGYVSGSGTHGLLWSLLGTASITGWDSMHIVRKQYRWLTRTICDLRDFGDIELYVFGFSRGAYQATLFTELVANLGVPTCVSNCRQNIRNFISHLKHNRDGKLETPKENIRVAVHYLGLIDAVRAVTSFPFVTCWKTNVKIDPKVSTCRHAVSIHELRRFFNVKSVAKYRTASGDKVDEAWFPGVHSDLANGYSGGSGNNPGKKWAFLSRWSFFKWWCPECHEKTKLSVSLIWRWPRLIQISLYRLRCRWDFAQGEREDVNGTFKLTDAKTTTIGNLVKAWILEPVHTSLTPNYSAKLKKANEEGCDTDDITKLLYSDDSEAHPVEMAWLVVLLPFILHNSFFDASNAYGSLFCGKPHSRKVDLDRLSDIAKMARAVYENFPDVFSDQYGKCLLSALDEKSRPFLLLKIDELKDILVNAESIIPEIQKFLVDQGYCKMPYKSIPEIANEHMSKTQDDSA